MAASPAGGGFEFGGAADVVGMGVGDEDGLDLEVVAVERGQDGLRLIAGVDDNGFASFRVADDMAVALEKADGKDFVNYLFHELINRSRQIPAHQTISPKTTTTPIRTGKANDFQIARKSQPTTGSGR